MRILVSNDDGVHAVGIEALIKSLKSMARIDVVAPDRNRSGASNSLTLDRPIRVATTDQGYFKVDGTPTDCVHLAITGLLDQAPDMVVSGINAGANMGDDVLYSGTVAAAIEGRSLGLPAMAISLVYRNKPQHYMTAAKVAKHLTSRLMEANLPVNTILNVNVPDVPWDQLKGFSATRLGNRHKAETLIKQEDPRGRMMYWIGPPGAAEDAGPGTDFFAVENLCVSITPLQVDMTRYPAVETVANWLGAIQLERNNG